MENVWMVRAGERGYLVDEFARGYVGIGWNEVGDMKPLSTQEDVRREYAKHFSDSRPSKFNNDVAMLHKFRSTIKTDDFVITYDKAKREILVGKIVSDYFFKPNEITDYHHLRKVEWEGRVSRDDLSMSSRNSLGSALTLFSVNEEIWTEIRAVLSGEKIDDGDDDKGEDEEFDILRKDIIEKASDFIIDKILELTPDELVELTAAILRGMGYRTSITPPGPDRGVDITASPDGLGLEEPRIKVEVKHRPKTSIGAQDVRSFIGGLRESDRALYVSSGGFSKDAKYEAERSNNPITLLGLEDLANLITTHYENFDLDGRALMPLIKVYWPVK